MASRLKEDEKNERTIRGLLKLPENKRCINCNSLGPQYVCTTFWTFVCTNCSGIHREFTHRVKSVSMAKFTSQEVGSLQRGGNKCAREMYFKGFDLQHQSLPDGSNVERLRDCIRHVYVNKRYMSEKNDDKPPRGQMGDKNDFHGAQSPTESRSPPYEDVYDRRYSDRSSPGARSPGFEPGSRKFGDYTKSPSRPEIVNDWYREDRFGNRRKSEEGSQSPEQVKDMGSSPPVVRPVREILGDSIIPLRVGEPPKSDNNRNSDVQPAKEPALSSTSSSTNENPCEVKVETAVSLIDFEADPGPPPAPVVTAKAPQSITSQPVVQPTGSADDNWASFDTPQNLNVSQSTTNGNAKDSLLSQLAGPSSVPVHTSGLPAGLATSVDISAFPANPPAAAAATRQWPNVQQQSPPFLPTPVGHCTPLNGPSSNQVWNSAPASNVQRSHSEPSFQPIQGVSQLVSSGGSLASETKPSGRKELPMDIFTAPYPSYHEAVPGWQARPPYGVGYGIQQYNTSMLQNFPQAAKSMNPFDFNNEPPPQTQTATQFPCMSSLHSALPPTVINPPSSLSTVSQPWMASQPHHHSAVSPQVPLHPPQGYMSPQMPGNMPPPSNVSHMGNMDGPYGSFQHTDQAFGGPFMGHPSNPTSPFPSGGNPFG